MMTDTSILTNDRTYEPLKNYVSLVEKKYLKSVEYELNRNSSSTLAGHPTDFQKEKIDFFTKYLLNKPGSLRILGLICPAIPEPLVVTSPEGAGSFEPTQGTVRRKTHRKKKPALESPESVLSNYFQNGIAEIEARYRLPIRDKVKAKILLKSAAAAWSSHLVRKMNKQLNLSLPEGLMNDICKLHESYRLDGLHVTKNDMMINALKAALKATKDSKPVFLTGEFALPHAEPSWRQNHPEVEDRFDFDSLKST